MAGLGRGLGSLLSGKADATTKDKEEQEQSSTSYAGQELINRSLAAKQSGNVVAASATASASASATVDAATSATSPENSDSVKISSVSITVVDANNQTKSSQETQGTQSAQSKQGAQGSQSGHGGESSERVKSFLTAPKPQNQMIHKILVSKIKPSRFQPRCEFADEAMQDLAASIKKMGMIDPILVRPIPNEDGYEILCGERRFRAAQMIGLKVVPCAVRELTDEQAYSVALAENLKRESLTSIEIARALSRMMEECNLSSAEAREISGYSTSQFNTTLRLMSLPNDVQELIAKGTLGYGHARAILGLDNAQSQSFVASEVVKQRLSVRQTEEYVQALKGNRGTKGVKNAVASSAVSESQDKAKEVASTLAQGRSTKNYASLSVPRFNYYEKTINEKVPSAQVKWVVHRKGKGKVVLSYDGEEGLEQLLSLLNLSAEVPETVTVPVSASDNAPAPSEPAPATAEAKAESVEASDSDAAPVATYDTATTTTTDKDKA